MCNACPIYIYIYICNNYSATRSALHHILYETRGRVAPEGEYNIMMQCTSSRAIIGLLQIQTIERSRRDIKKLHLTFYRQ